MRSPDKLQSAVLTAWPPGLFRFIHVLGAVVWIGFGFAIAVVLPQRWDPPVVRGLMSALYVGLVAMSWSGRYDWTSLRRAALAVYYVTTLHAFVMLVMNDAAPPYAVVLIVNNVGIASGLDRPREQAAWGIYSVVGSAIAWGLLPEPQTPVLFVLLSLICFHAVFSAVYRRIWGALNAAVTQQDLFTATFDNSGDALLLLSPEQQVARANAHAEGLLQTREGDLLGRPYAALFADPAEGGPDVAGRSISTLQRDNGDSFVAEVVRNDLPGQAGAVVRLSDVTQAQRDREFLQASLRQAKAAANAKGTFIATMSHEIRTPMTGVLGMLQLLEDGTLTEQQRQRVAAGTRSAQSLRRILDEILEYSKLESGRMTVNPQPTDPRALMRELADLFAPQLAHKGLEMPVRVDDDVPAWVMLDLVRVRQVLLNLVGNAEKFTEAGWIAVSLSAEPAGGLRWTVQDSGVGIAADALARIFEPFVQADASNTRAHGGTGLGLAISRQLAQLMGGDLDAVSVPGEGSTFTLRLQAPRVPAPEQAQPEQDATPSAQRALKVLVAEDNPVNRLVVDGLLRRLGVRATLVEDGAAAVSAVRAEVGWDLILMDIQMPIMDGLDATRAIRTEHPGVHHIVALTASVAQAERQSCLDAGMDEVLAKPVDIAELRQLLADLPQPVLP